MLFDPFTAAIHSNLLMNMLLLTVIKNHAAVLLCCAAMNASFRIVGRLMSWLTDCELLFL
jgi:hypothetical protein